MTKETKFLLKESSKYNIIIGLCVFIILALLKKANIGAIYFLGLIIATINFCIASIKVDNHLNGKDSSRATFRLSYIFRIGLIVTISVILSEVSSYLITYILGFISHYPILIISYIRNREEVI